MCGYKAMLSVDWVFPTPAAERRTMYHWTGNRLKDEAETLSDYEGGQRWKNAKMYKPFRKNIKAICLVWYFDPRVVPGTSHKLLCFWYGPYQVTLLKAPALAEIKTMQYPREERLVSLDVLKLYPEEDVIHQTQKM